MFSIVTDKPINIPSESLQSHLKNIAVCFAHFSLSPLMTLTHAFFALSVIDMHWRSAWYLSLSNDSLSLSRTHTAPKIVVSPRARGGGLKKKG